jgi:hypothetical protein
LAIGDARFRVADEAPKAMNLSPEVLGGTSVRINLLVEKASSHREHRAGAMLGTMSCGIDDGRPWSEDGL